MIISQVDSWDFILNDSKLHNEMLLGWHLKVLYKHIKFNMVAFNYETICWRGEYEIHAIFNNELYFIIGKI